MNTRKKDIPVALAVFPIVISCLVLPGAFDTGLFKWILPGVISMKFNTPACFRIPGSTE